MTRARLPVLLAAVLLAGCPVEVLIGDRDHDADVDGDQFPSSSDCDDNNPDVHPYAAEQCDRLDNNCNGLADEAACDVLDSFSQEAVLDMLLVIDSSLSMTGDQIKVRDAIDNFLFWAFGQSNEHDTHVGVLTADMNDPVHSGRLVRADGIYYLTREMGQEEARDWLANAVLVGNEGDPNVQSRGAIKAALTAPLLYGENSGFLRSDSHLAIIVVSDQDDDADNVPRVDPFVDWLDTLTAGQLGSTVHAVVGPDPAEDACPDDFGEQILKVVAATGGLEEWICDDDFGGFFDSVAQVSIQAANPDHYPLSEDPVWETIEVEVILASVSTYLDAGDGGFVAVEDTREIWIPAKPAVGSEIRIRYQRQPTD